MAVILLVEDEIDISNVIRANLEASGHTVRQAFDGRVALSAVEEHRPNLIILDWMLPGLDGLTVCRRIRENNLTPIIMLTARDEEIDRVLGLEVGADDYICKPFSMRELVARVQAILRRAGYTERPVLQPSPLEGAFLQNSESTESTVLSTGFSPQPDVLSPPIICGPLQIDLANRTVKLDGAELELTRKEYDLVLLFASHPGRTFSREYLLKHVWEYSYDGFDRTVDAHITRLRRKLGPLGQNISTVWGVGYRLVV